MALTQTEQAALRTIIARDGGLDAVIDEVRDLVIKDKKAAAVAALGNSVTVTVANWNTPAVYVAQGGSFTLPSVIADINAAWGAHDQAALGPLFVQLFAASKAHLGL